MKDSELVKMLKPCVRDTTFGIRLKFVRMFSTWFCHIEIWGSSCPCHQDEFDNHVAVNCNYKGKVLPIAWRFICDRCAEILDAVASWTLAQWGGGLLFFDKIKACTRASVQRLKLKLGFIDRLPYIIALLGFDPGARGRIMDQFNSVPRDKHHRRTLALCDAGELHTAMQSMTDHRDLSDESLRTFVTSIREAPFNDEVNEKPHAGFGHEHRHCNRSNFGWKAATVRMHQNIGDADHMSSVTGESLQKVYDSSKSVIQTGTHRRSVRCSRRAFEDRLYHCRQTFDPSGSDEYDDDDDERILF